MAVFCGIFRISCSWRAPQARMASPSTSRLVLAVLVGVSFSAVDVPLVARALGVILVTFVYTLLQAPPADTATRSPGVVNPDSSDAAGAGRRGEGVGTGVKPRPGSPSSFGRARSPLRPLPNPLDAVYYADPDPRVVSRPASRRSAGGARVQPPLRRACGTVSVATDRPATTSAASDAGEEAALSGVAAAQGASRRWHRRWAAHFPGAPIPWAGNASSRSDMVSAFTCDKLQGMRHTGAMRGRDGHHEGAKSGKPRRHVGASTTSAGVSVHAPPSLRFASE